jgi:hypothetical protein
MSRGNLTFRLQGELADAIARAERAEADRDALARDLAAARGLLREAQRYVDPDSPTGARIRTHLVATPEREPGAAR